MQNICMRSNLLKKRVLKRYELQLFKILSSTLEGNCWQDLLASISVCFDFGPVFCLLVVSATRRLVQANTRAITPFLILFVLKKYDTLVAKL